MNDLKTNFQEKMAHETLRDLVLYRFGGTQEYLAGREAHL
jgi:hypothetical protein